VVEDDVLDVGRLEGVEELSISGRSSTSPETPSSRKTFTGKRLFWRE
jgi:hypothetical protein